jgi:hypothetical protein
VLAPFRYNVKSNGSIVIVIGEPLVECSNHANDAAFIIRGTNTDAMRISLSGALGRTTRLYKEHGFQINGDKCFYTFLTFRHADPTLELYVDIKKIREEENLVYLGVTLDRKLTGQGELRKSG